MLTTFTVSMSPCASWWTRIEPRLDVVVLPRGAGYLVGVLVVHLQAGLGLEGDDLDLAGEIKVEECGRRPR